MSCLNSKSYDSLSMSDLEKVRLFRITHIDNMQHILQYGITHSSSKFSNPNYAPIGDNSLISIRSNYRLRNGKLLGDYIPFYFGPRSPMQYVVQKGHNMVKATAAEDIVYCISSVQKIIDCKLDFIFTDGHAINSLSKQFNPTDIDNIYSIIDQKAILDKYWNDEDDLDKKRRKEAEFLVLGDIPIETILGYVTFNEFAKKRMTSYGVNCEKVIVKPNYYF